MSSPSGRLAQDRWCITVESLRGVPPGNHVKESKVKLAFRMTFGIVCLAFTPAALAADNAATGRKTENVVLFMTDGLRWQEVFERRRRTAVDQGKWRRQGEPGRSAPQGLFARLARGAPRRRSCRSFGRCWPTRVRFMAIPRRERCPGHQRDELFLSWLQRDVVGFADPRIDSNDKVPNPNVTVFEWLHRKPAYHGRVAAFGCWDAFPFIFNRERCGFFINAGYEPWEDAKQHVARGDAQSSESRTAAPLGGRTLRLVHLLHGARLPEGIPAAGVLPVAQRNRLLGARRRATTNT